MTSRLLAAGALALAVVAAAAQPAGGTFVGGAGGDTAYGGPGRDVCQAERRIAC